MEYQQDENHIQTYNDSTPSFLVPSRSIFSSTASAIPFPSLLTSVEEDVDTKSPSSALIYSHRVQDTGNQQETSGTLQHRQSPTKSTNDMGSMQQQQQREQQQQQQQQQDFILQGSHAAHKHVAENEESLDGGPSSSNSVSLPSHTSLPRHQGHLKQHSGSAIVAVVIPAVPATKLSRRQPETRKLIHSSQSSNTVHSSTATNTTTTATTTATAIASCVNKSNHRNPKSKPTSKRHALDSATFSSSSSSNSSSATSSSRSNNRTRIHHSDTQQRQTQQSQTPSRRRRSHFYSHSHSHSYPHPHPHRRRRLTIEETEHLLTQFTKNEKPTSKERRSIAQELELDERTVQVWFQNRRAKIKRDESLALIYYSQQQEQQQQQQQSEKLKQRQGRGQEQIVNDTKMKDSFKGENEDEKEEDSDSDDGDESIEDEKDSSKYTSTDDDDRIPGTSNSIIATTALKDPSPIDVIHRGSGTETFIGYERSDPGLSDPWLMGNGFQQTMHAINSNIGSPSGGGSSTVSFSSNTTITHGHGRASVSAIPSSSRPKSITSDVGHMDDSRFKKVENGADYYSYGATSLDSDCELGLEMIFGLQPGGGGRMDLGLGLEIGSPLLTTEQGNGDCVGTDSSTTSLSRSASDDSFRVNLSLSEDTAHSSMPSFSPSPLRDQEGRQQPQQQQQHSAALHLLPSAVHRSAYLMQLENPIPRHQMALTLIPTAAAKVSAPTNDVASSSGVTKRRS